MAAPQAHTIHWQPTILASSNPEFPVILESVPEHTDTTRNVPSQTVDLPDQVMAAATLVDESDPLFSMYNETREKHDRDLAQNWRSDADFTAIVNGLFSVMVAILLRRPYQDLRLNSQDVSAFYLSQIYQLSAGQNTTTPLPVKVPDPSTFSPTLSSVRTSALWTLSLVISLACTVIATLLRQWGLRYLQITREPRGTRNRARIRELVAQGVEREQLQRLSSVLPGLFHLSALLFLYGLIHSSDNSAVDLVILSIAVICIGLYCFASVITLFPFGKICYTPLSSFVWFSSSRIFWLTYKLLYNSSKRLPFIGYRTKLHLWEMARARLRSTFRETVVNMADQVRKRSPSLDTSVVSWVFDSLDGHEDMERFLSAIPGFYKSSEVKKDVSVLEGLNDRKLAPAIASFMDHSSSSNLLTDFEKQRRITICVRAMNADPLLLRSTFSQILQSLNSDIFEQVDFVHAALDQLHREDSDPWVKDYAQCILAVAINRMPGDLRAWYDVASRYVKPHHAQYRLGGPDLQLCNLIYVTRHLKDFRLENSNQFKQGGVYHDVLAEALKFDFMATAPNLQLEFRALLTELHLMASAEVGSSEMAQSNAQLVLSSIRTAFGPLHEGTAASPDEPSSSTSGRDLVHEIPPRYEQLSDFPMRHLDIESRGRFS